MCMNSQLTPHGSLSRRKKQHHHRLQRNFFADESGSISLTLRSRTRTQRHCDIDNPASHELRHCCRFWKSDITGIFTFSAHRRAGKETPIPILDPTTILEQKDSRSRNPGRNTGQRRPRCGTTKRDLQPGASGQRGSKDECIPEQDPAGLTVTQRLFSRHRTLEAAASSVPSRPIPCAQPHAPTPTPTGSCSRRASR